MITATDTSSNDSVCIILKKFENNNNNNLRYTIYSMKDPNPDGIFKDLITNRSSRNVFNSNSDVNSISLDTQNNIKKELKDEINKLGLNLPTFKIDYFP